MATNEILQFAGTVGADNLITQADYLADAGNIRTIGNVPGIADDRLVNKALRQATLVAAALAQFTADNQANDVLDTLTPATLAGYMQAAMASLAASGMLTKAVGGASDVTLTAGEAANTILKFTGVLTGNITVYVPASITRLWTIDNATTGEFTITVAPTGGVGVTIDQGYYNSIWSDGTNAYNTITERASTTKAGLALLATIAEAQAAIDTAKTLTPAGFRSAANRSTSIASSATPTPAADTTDEYIVTAQAVGATFGAPTSATATLYEGQVLIIRIKDNGTANTLAWNAAYRSGSAILPTTTVVGKTHYIALLYNAVDSKWDCVGVSDVG